MEQKTASSIQTQSESQIARPLGFYQDDGCHLKEYLLAWTNVLFLDVPLFRNEVQGINDQPFQNPRCIYLN